MISLKEICVSSLRTSSPPQRKPKGCERSDRCLRCAPHSPTPGENIYEHILMPLLVVYSGQQRCCDDPTRLRPTWSRTSNRLRINPSAVCSDESAPYTWARHIGHNTIEGDSSIFRGCPSDFLSSIDGRALCVFLSIVIKNIYIKSFFSCSLSYTANLYNNV